MTRGRSVRAGGAGRRTHSSAPASAHAAGTDRPRQDVALEQSLERAAIAARAHAVITLGRAGIALRRHVRGQRVLGDFEAGVVRLPVARQVVECRGAARAEAQVLGEMIAIAMRILVAGLVVKRVGPDAALDEVQSRMVWLVVDVNVARVPVRRYEQVPPSGMQRARRTAGPGRNRGRTSCPIGRRNSRSQSARRHSPSSHRTRVPRAAQHAGTCGHALRKLAEA